MQLIKHGILIDTEAGVANQSGKSDDSSTAQAVVEPKEPARKDPTVVGSPLNDPKLALQLKQLDLELARKHYEAQLLQFRMVELESQREIKLKELELALRNKPASDSLVRGPLSPGRASSPVPHPAPATPVQANELSPALSGSSA
ncbi:gypsy-16 si, partial [Clarias magur]